MRLSKLYYWIFLCFGVVAFINCSSDTKTLKIIPSAVDFGRVYLTDYVEVDHTLTNKYGKEITLTNFTINGTS